jgi:hypothetical protein
MTVIHAQPIRYFNPLNAKLNPICHLLALLEAHHILHVSRIRVNNDGTFQQFEETNQNPLDVCKYHSDLFS